MASHPRQLHMSEYLRAAREKLRAAVADLDARLSELQAEQVVLTSARDALLVIIDGPGGQVQASAPPSEVRHEAVTRQTAGGSTPPASAPTRVPPVDATARIEHALRSSATPLRCPDLLRASKLSKHRAKRLLAELVTTGRLVRTGKTQSVRYSLASGRAKRVLNTASGNGKPADDDAPGAVQDTTSAGDAGVVHTPVKPRLQQPVLRPPVRNTQSAKSLGKGSPAHRVETDDVDPFDDESDEAPDGELGDVDDIPPYRAAPVAARPTYYKPGTRHQPAASTTATHDGSWWMRKDADFAAAAERMRHAKGPVIPSANKILAMSGCW